MIGALLVLTGCMGPSEETLVDTLQVVSLLPEPPEVAPGDDVAVTPVVVDPEGAGAEVLVWTCTVADGGCAEADLPVSAWTRMVAPGDAAVLEAPEALAGVAGDGVPIPVHALACEPGLCPLFDDVRDAGDATASRALAADLADPARWLADLPIEGVSAASKAVWVSEVEVRNANPVIAPRFDAVTAAPGDEVRLRFYVADDAPGGLVSWAYTTAGGFEGTNRDVVDGAVTWTWFAPDRRGAVELFVAVDDSDGGTALWRGAVEVR